MSDDKQTKANAVTAASVASFKNALAVIMLLSSIVL